MNQKRKDMIQQAFDTVADGYDHPSLAFFPETSERMLAHLNMSCDQHLLDVCTGTGMVALNAAQMLGQGKVTGIDLSTGMLEQARKKAAETGLMNTEFIQMDLDHLNFSAQTFDVATSSFGLFFIEDMGAALKNVAETVKSGGKIAISSFTGKAFQPFSDMFLECYQSFGMEVPPLSWKRLESEQSIRDLFSIAGIDNVELYHESLSYDIKSEQQWWDIVWNAGYRGLLNQLSDSQLDEFEQQHRSQIAQLCEQGDAKMDVSVIIAVGNKA